MKKISLLSAIGLLALASCKNNINPDKASAPGLNFDNYVAIGNSLTAGYADNSLYKSGQESSYPAILAEQFSYVGLKKFRQPLTVDNSGYPQMKMILGYKEDCATGVIGVSPVPMDGIVNPANATNISSYGPYNNIGVPGIRLFDIIIPMYSSFNPYSSRMLSSAEASGTFFSYIVNQKPTFFTNWLGNNDVLGYATNGGVGNASGYALGDITPILDFKVIYDSLVNALVKDGAKGVLITIPDVTSIPFFTTIPYEGVELSRVGQVDTLNAYYLANPEVSFKLGINGFVIEDASVPGGLRHMKEGEYVLMTASDSIKCAGWGTTKPLPDEYVLDEEEVKNIKDATDAFNFIIKDNALRHKLALFDAHSYMKTMSSGMYWNGVNYNLTYITGGVFSLDGIHLTPRGYAIVANEIIKAINSHYKTSINQADVHKYDGLIFP